jgi:DNA-binding MarR family transcriptional regulator
VDSRWGPGRCGPRRRDEAEEPLDPSSVGEQALPAALLVALRRFGPSWVRWLRGHVGEAGLSPERLHLLGALAAAGRPLIMREITTRLGTTPRAVTALVDALEGDGLVRRSAHPDDRRAVLVEPRPAGEQLLHSAGRGLTRAAALFDVLTPAEQRTLLELLGRLTAALEERAAELPADDPGPAGATRAGRPPRRGTAAPGR